MSRYGHLQMPEQQVVLAVIRLTVFFEVRGQPLAGVRDGSRCYSADQAESREARNGCDAASPCSIRADRPGSTEVVEN